MYMYFLNLSRSFSCLARDSPRASCTHDGIVRSPIPYGAYFDFVTVLFRSDLGRCRTGIGRHAFAPAGCNAEGSNVRYSSLYFGGCFALPVKFGR